MKNRGYSSIGLYQPKDHKNVGSVLRACSVFDVSLLVTSGRRYQKHSTDTTSGYRHMPFQQGVSDLRDYIPYDAVPVAVDIIPGAINLFEYKHPERAFYVFGPEDGTLGSSVTDWCRDVVYVPTHYCMNLAASVNVLLYDRAAKNFRKQQMLASNPTVPLGLDQQLNQEYDRYLMNSQTSVVLDKV